MALSSIRLLTRVVHPAPTESQTVGGPLSRFELHLLTASLRGIERVTTEYVSRFPDDKYMALILQELIRIGSRIKAALGVPR
jgi:hypothetical protein